MTALARGGRLRRVIAARSPRLSLALPALIAILLGLLTARAALAIARDAAPPDDGATEAPPGGATSSDSPRPGGGACPLPGLRPEEPGSSAKARVEGRPPLPPLADAILLAPAGGLPSGGRRPAPEPGGRPGVEPLSPQAPCSQRAPPAPASPSRGG